MSVQLAPELNEIVDRLVAGGEYESREAVVRAAIERLARKEAECAAIRAGLDDVEAGRVVPHEQVVQEMREDLRSRPEV